MHWNHRVVKKVYENGEIQLGIHEVFYNEDGSIYAYTTDPMEACIVGDCENELLDNLREYLEWMQRALEKPVLVDGEVEFKHDPIEDQIDELMKLDTLKDIIKALKELDKEHDHPA